MTTQSPLFFDYIHQTNSWSGISRPSSCWLLGLTFGWQPDGGVSAASIFYGFPEVGSNPTGMPLQHLPRCTYTTRLPFLVQPHACKAARKQPLSAKDLKFWMRGEWPCMCYRFTSPEVVSQSQLEETFPALLNRILTPGLWTCNCFLPSEISIH